MNMNSKNALVLGAGGKIGSSIAETLKATGANVFSQTRKDKEFTDTESIKSFCEDILIKFDGKLDILVNCIGDFYFKPLEELKPEDFRNIIESNLSFAFDFCHFLLPSMRQNPEGGKILNIGFSGASNIQAKPNILAYHIGKLGLLLLTKSLAKTEAKNKILVNCLSLGVTEANNFECPVEIPLKRPCSLKEISETALFILNSNYMTGQEFSLDGGFSL